MSLNPFESSESQTGDINICNDEQNVVECSPRTCINVKCNCNFAIGVKNGQCSGEIL